jgi:glycosyltransferase involved in cell wall biosynthesis
VLPSLAEGVPKVVQEAVACGLPAIVFGYYETPSVVDGENGFVVWSLEQLLERTGELSADPNAARAMGRKGATMAEEWDWDRVAPLWEARILEVIRP